MTERRQPTIIDRNKKRSAVAIFLFSLLCASAVQADIESDDEETLETPVHTQRQATIQSGYRFITPDGHAAAAAPYSRLKSGVNGGFLASTLGPDLKLTVDGSFLHEDDYHTELFFDYGGLVRLHLESGALWHNLLRDQVNPGTLGLISLEQNQTYGVRTAVSQADTRIRLGNNPFHLNLGYWELRRDGFEQLRFSDHYFGTAANTILTDTRRIANITREGHAGLDAHLGPFDLSYGFRLRDFSNEAVDQRYDSFTVGTNGTPTGARHNVTPNSSVTSHTFKMFTDLSGGLVGSASYNLTQRENNQGHGDATPSGHPADTIHSVAGDLTYTPSKRHSFALKYRHREIQRSTPVSLTYPYSQIEPPPSGIYTATPGELLIRPSTSSVKDIVTLSATFRPAPKVIYRLEYNAELESRDNLRDSLSPAGLPTGLHADHRQTHTGTATFYWKPTTGVKLNATYAYATCDNPAYASSFSEQHTGKLLLTYTTNTRWGISSSYIARQESTDNSTAQVAKLPRDSRADSANAALWFAPAERLVVTTSYSFLRNNTDQTILFTSQSLGTLAASNYRSQAHVYGLDAVYALSENLDISASFQQTRSISRFTVPPLADLTFSSAGITELTTLNSTETGVSTRADWRMTALLGCSLDYNFRMYESGQPLYDGKVHATMLTLKARW